jgi:hypothetical protein
MGAAARFQFGNYACFCGKHPQLKELCIFFRELADVQDFITGPMKKERFI